MAIWLERGIFFISAFLNRLADEWRFLDVPVLFWIVAFWVVTVIIRNFIYDV